jgi:hypothetical protein
MKPKIFIAVIVFLLCSLSASAQTEEYNYSVKNRWTVKASYSRYKTSATDWGAFMSVGDFFDIWQNRKMTNFKLEANYGISKFIEMGLYTGFQCYEWYNDENEVIEIIDDIIYTDGGEVKKSFAPLLGATVNFHVLPFLVPSKECRWDLYLTAKYGGGYFSHKSFLSHYLDDSKYRQEYGLGMGAGYYFKNIIGIFAEGSVGQYAFFKHDPEVHEVDGAYINVITTRGESNFRFRIGIAAKINK